MLQEEGVRFLVGIGCLSVNSHLAAMVGMSLGSETGDISLSSE